MKIQRLLYSSSNGDSLVSVLEQIWKQEQICQGCTLWRSYQELDDLWHCINSALHDPKNIDNWHILDEAKQVIEIRLAEISQSFDEPIDDDFI